MTTYTTNLAIPHLGQNVAQPEIPVNDAINILDAADSGIFTKNFDSGDTLLYTLDESSLTYPQEIHYAILNITNTGAAISTQINYIIPTTTKGQTFIKKYIINNQTGQIVNISQDASGISEDILSNTIAQIYCDGINIIRIT